MKKRNFKSTGTGIGLSILLSATALLVMQLSGGGRLTASDSDEPMTQAAVCSRVIAEHPPAEIVEKRDDHTRIWEIVREVETTHPDGSVTVDTIKSYIHEKASGLCYKDATGNYVPSVAEWRETRDGFVIDRCPYRLVMGKTIGTSARYTVEGNDLLLRPAYLIISDGVNQADPRPLTPEARGSISPDNPSVLRFPAAFGEGYDLEYVAEKGGFHQNLIIANPPRLPAGFNPATASIYLYTELNLDQYLSTSGCEVAVEGEPVNATAPEFVTEPSRGGCISFSKDGRVLHAFSVSQVTDSSGPGALDKQTTAEKRLMKDPASGKAYLVESLPLSYFMDRPLTYPITWDYESKSGSIGTQTWEPRYTYRITGNVTVSGTLTILPGTTVKLDPSKKIIIASGGKVIARGEPYNYIVFTNSSDNNCGEIITGPADAAYDKALEILSGSSSQSVVQYCKIGRGNTGMSVGTGLVSPIAHNVFRYNTYYGITLSNCTTAVHNNLITDSQYGIYGYYYSYSSLTNNTIDNCSYAGIYTSGAWGLSAYDNIFTDCYYGVYASGGNVSVHHCAWDWYVTYMYGVNLGPGNVNLYEAPYDQSSTFGGYYLSDAGVAALGEQGSRSASDAGLNGEVLTLRAPDEVTTTEYKDARVWDKITYRDEEPYSLDTAQVAIGYHHSRTDRYLRSALTVRKTTGSLTIEPGAVIAVKGDKYLLVTEGAKLLCVGDPGAGGYNQLTCSKALSMNIESPQFGDTTGNPYIYLSSGASEASSMQYTRMTWLGWGVLIDPGRWLREPIQHNVFSLSYYGIHAGIDSGNVLFNNLFYDNVQAAYAESDAQGRAAVRNCTFDKNTTGLRVYAGSGETLPITDCLFTNNLAEGILINAGAGTIANDYNAFWQNAVDVNGGTRGPHSKVLSRSPYNAPLEHGWQLHYRLEQDYTPADESPVNHGSQTSLKAGLDLFTTDAECSWDEDQLDIGYHFPNILRLGYGQTRLALYYHNVYTGCVRAFGFDGDATDMMGNAEGTPTGLGYGFYRYSPSTTGSDQVKFDFTRVGAFGGGVTSQPIAQGLESGGTYTGLGVRNYRVQIVGIGTPDTFCWSDDGTTTWDGGPTGISGSEQPLNYGVTVKFAQVTGHTLGQRWDFTAVSSIVDCGSNPDIDTMQAFSVSCWVEPLAEQRGTRPTICGKSYASGGGWYLYLERQVQGSEMYRPRAGVHYGGAWLEAYPQGYDIGPESWKHFAATWNGATQSLNVYVGGIQVAQATGSGSQSTDDSDNLFVGGRRTGSDQWADFFRGWIADFFVHRRVLSPDEIRWIALNGDYQPGNPTEEWLVTPNLGAMGEYAPAVGQPTRFPVGQMQSASGCAVDSQGNIWVAEFYVPRVSNLSPTGEVLKTLGGSWSSADGQFYGPWSVALDEAGNLYVSETGNHRIQKFAPDGTFITKWGSWGAAEGQFKDPRCLAIGWDTEDVWGHREYVYVADVYNYRIQKFTTEGQFVRRWGSEFTGENQADRKYTNQFVDLRGIAVDADENVWVCDRGKYGDKNYIKVFTPKGEPIYEGGQVKVIDAEDENCTGLAIDKLSGNMYITGGEMWDQEDHLQMRDSSGALIAEWGGLGVGEGNTSGPWGVGLGSDGGVWLTDWFACNVQKFRVEGSPPRGVWEKTLWSPLRDDANTFKCKNHTKYGANQGQPKQLWQRVYLASGQYRIRFLAFTNGEPVGSNDVVPFAAKAVETDPPGPNELQAPPAENYDNYVLTYVAGQDGSKACRVWTDFTVGPAESGTWDIGVEVKTNADPTRARLVYVASLVCFKKPE